MHCSDPLTAGPVGLLPLVGASSPCRGATSLNSGRISTGGNVGAPLGWGLAACLIPVLTALP